MKKTYYRIKFQLKSALSIGSGNNENTDKDMVKDSSGNPFIPGTSMAGIMRSIYSEKLGKTEKQVHDSFGNVKIATKVGQKTEAVQSSLLIYDAYLAPESKGAIARRDCVGLDEFKTAKNGAKFDFEVVEAGAEFITYIEEQDKDEAKEIVSYIQKHGFMIGAKTQRGLGKAVVKEIMTASFEIRGEASDDTEKWLNFDMYSDRGWKPFTAVAFTMNQKENTLHLELKQVGGISIREYTTQVATNKQSSVPDYSQLEYTHNGKTYAVIPGTSWSGAFRHNMEKLGKMAQIKNVEALLSELYGKEKGDGAHASKIRFSESQIEIGNGKTNGKEKVISRNAIDRFTGGTADGALYTEKFVYGGSTTLDISIPSDTESESVKLLAASVADLHYGYLAIGGLTAVGRGLFEITAVNGKKANPDKLYDQLLEELARKGM